MTKPKLSNFRTQRLNANKHTPRGLGLLADSIGQDGWIGAMTVAADGETFDGSARLEVLADAMPSAEPIVVDSDGTRPVIVRRTDIPSTDDPRAKRLGLGANRIAQVDLDWDADALAALAGDVDLSKLWNKDELAELLKGMGGNDAEDPGAQVDKAAELQAKWGTALGQLWAIGRHRLLVGDCTVAENVARLMGGEKAALAWFDPPFGIDLQPQRGLTDAIANDGNAEARVLWAKFLPLLVDNLTDPAHVFLCQGWTEFDWTLPLVRKHFTLKSKVVWYKNVWGIGYYTRPQHEDVIYCWKGKPETLAEPVSDVWEVARESAPDHAAEKPPELSGRAIEFFSERGAIVADWFCGVGGVFVACEKLGRIGRGMELSPAYAAVTLERLHGLGLTPELVA